MATTPLAVTQREITRSLARAAKGNQLDQREVVALLAARGDDLTSLCAIARGIADKGSGRRITYSPKVFIPLTKLCRDSCHYCTFVDSPAAIRKSGQSMYLEIDEVVELAQAGAQTGCYEALFTLGDRPEDRWPAARTWLDERGYDSTLAYVRAAAIAVLEKTGLLPHLNPGVMSWEEMARLRPVAPSMGMMLETTSRRLFDEPGQVHYGSPDKDPAVRLAVLEDAGRLSIPFTTGILVGIGETPDDTAEALFALRRIGREYGHIQEVIIQNFRAKPATALATRPDVGIDEYVATVATARIVLGPTARVQAPPNLTDEVELTRLLDAGVDDWGGVSPVTPDHVNPERPWPDLDRLRELTERAGYQLAPRLTAHPKYVLDRDRWIDPALHAHIDAIQDATGLANARARATGLPWQVAHSYDAFAEGEAGGRTNLNKDIDLTGRSSDRRSDFDVVYGEWDEIARRVDGTEAPDGAPDGLDIGPLRPSPTKPNASLEPPPPDSKGTNRNALATALKLAADDPGALALESNREAAVALMSCDGDALEELVRLADDVRRDAVGDDVTFVVNRNINFTNVCYTGCRFCAFAQRKSDADAFTLSLDEVGDRVDEAWNAGATEICMQGGIHPDLPGSAYFDLARAIKSRQPDIHLHAFSPMEVVNGATRSNMSIRDWLIEAKASGVDTIPGTAAEILDDDIRWVLTKGKLPASQWIEVVTTAHDVGLRSSSTMMYGHVDKPAHWVAHLALLRQIQERTGGFTEFVGLPFVHHNAPLYLAGIARPGSTLRDDLAVTAMSRLMLHGAIDNIQVSWVKLGPQGCGQLLNAGANDLGGTLMEETISRMAGSEHGSAMTAQDLAGIAATAGRPARQRTTTYGRVPLHLSAHS